MSDWYSVRRKPVEIHGGRGLFRYYSSLEAALRAIYPEYPWDSALFIEHGVVRAGFWKVKKNLLDALSRAEAKLGIKEVALAHTTRTQI